MAYAPHWDRERTVVAGTDRPEGERMIAAHQASGHVTGPLTWDRRLREFTFEVDVPVRPEHSVAGRRLAELERLEEQMHNGGPAMTKQELAELEDMR